MIVNGANLRTLGVGFQRTFQAGLDEADVSYQQIATTVNSTTASNEYGWLGVMPGMREWIGDRVINQIDGHSYTIRNRKFEDTIAVKRDHIEDDNIGVYGPLFGALGRTAGAFPAELNWTALAAGFETPCYDGQNFFDTDHPVIVGGAEQSYSNMQAGAGSPWFLMDLSKPLKPLLYQERKKPEFQSKTDPASSDHVFMRDEFLWGTSMRCNVGYGFWQLAFGSKAALTEESFEEAYFAMRDQKNDAGRPLAIKATHLVVGSSNLKAAEEILKKDRKQNGEDNINQGRVQLFDSPWLA